MALHRCPAARRLFAGQPTSGQASMDPIRTLEHGEGPGPVFVLHGGPGAPGSAAPLARALANCATFYIPTTPTRAPSSETRCASTFPNSNTVSSCAVGTIRWSNATHGQNTSKPSVAGWRPGLRGDTRWIDVRAQPRTLSAQRVAGKSPESSPSIWSIGWNVHRRECDRCSAVLKTK